MKLAIVTMEVQAGRCEANYAYMCEMIEQAKRDHADMILFPQDAISGNVGDGFKDPDYCRYLDSFNERIIAQSETIAIVWGNIRYRGGHLFHCAFLAKQKETYMRVKAKGNDLFYDETVFSESSINKAIEFQDQYLALNFGAELQLCDWNINLDARPYDVHEEMKLRGNVIYVNAVGMQNKNKAVVMMEGGSAIYENGNCMWQMPYGESGYALIETTQLKKQEPLKRDLLELLAQAIRGFDRQILGGRCPWIIGLSGGLDSGVSAALLTYALGSERIIGYSMSSAHNSKQTKENARHSASVLGIAFHEGSIAPLVDASDVVLQAYGYPASQDLVRENVQARLRGHLLSTFAAIHGGVVVNNGNKVENALGYCTLYGDAIGALGILGDLTKVQLFELAKMLNQRMNKEAVPTNLLPVCKDGTIHFEVAPTAELKADQIDPMKWFYHDYLCDHLGRDLTLTAFLKQYLDGSLLRTELGDIMRFYHLDEPSVFLADLNWFLSTCRRNLFKHTQVPAILTISRNAYAFRNEVQGFETDAAIAELLDAIALMKRP